MSILAVTAPATRRGLTAIATVKRELGITGSADHEFLEDLILQASAVIEGWCSRVFGREEVTETFRLSAERAVLHLARWPNVALASIGEDGVTLAADDWELDAATGELWRLCRATGEPVSEVLGTCWRSVVIVVNDGGWTAVDCSSAGATTTASRHRATMCGRLSWLGGTRGRLRAAELVATKIFGGIARLPDTLRSATVKQEQAV